MTPNHVDAHLYQEDLAYIHHHGFSDLARAAGPWLLRTLHKAGLRQGTIVELGCGGGVLLAELAAAGYRVVGVDSSASMLEIASSTAPAAELLQGSLYDAPIPACSTVVSVGEALSYVTGPDVRPPTRQLFERITSALAPGGLLLFDTIVRGAEPFTAYRNWASGDDWACLVDVQPHPTSPHLRRAITTFRRVGETYRRGYEEHWVYLFSRPELLRQLQEAGFTVRTSRGYGRVRLAPGRRLFHCSRTRA